MMAKNVYNSARRPVLVYTQPSILMGILTLSDKIFQRHLCLEILADALFTARLLDTFSVRA